MTLTHAQPARHAVPGTYPLLPAAAVDLAEHLARNGPLPRYRGDGGLVEVVRAAGLTGRGGAGFPTHRKLAAVRAAAGRRGAPRPVVIANGAEGEPFSAKDAVLLRYAPHLILDGLQLAAEAVGAGRAYLYLPDRAQPRPGSGAAEVGQQTSPDGAGPAAVAVIRRWAAGVDRIPVSLQVAPAGFLAGEESAVVSAVSGGPARPRDRLQRVTDAGVRGAPTLVQNVETLAHLALIARYGPDWFRRYGTAEEPGTFLATVGGPVAVPGVYEVPYGVRLGDLLALAGGPTAPLSAVLVGGYHGAWVPAVPQLPVSRAGLAGYGAAPGAGVVLPLDRGGCGLAVSAEIARYLAAASAGQCGPCVRGLPRLADTLGALARRERRPGLPAEIDRLVGLVTGRGACRHPDGTTRLVGSAMRAFAADVSAHLAGGCLAERASRVFHPAGRSGEPRTPRNGGER